MKKIQIVSLTGKKIELDQVQVQDAAQACWSGVVSAKNGYQQAAFSNAHLILCSLLYGSVKIKEGV